MESFLQWKKCQFQRGKKESYTNYNFRERKKMNSQLISMYIGIDTLGIEIIPKNYNQ